MRSPLSGRIDLRKLTERMRTGLRGNNSFWLGRNMRPVLFFVVVATVAGVYLATQVPTAVFPETNFPRVVIGIDNGVMPVEQMEVTITRPVEDAVNAVPGLENVRSITSRGSAEVSLFFNWNVDMFQTLQYVNAAISRVEQTLPATAHITVNRLTFATFPILGYSLTSDSVSQSRLWEIATYDLKPPLNRLPGVSSVAVQGGKVPEFHIVPSPAKLQETGVTVTDILNAVQQTNLIDSPGLYESQHQLILGLVGGQVHNADELSQIVIKTTAAGIPVRIGDVADVQPAPMPVYTIVTANGKPSVLLNVTRQPSSNTVAVADEVAAEMARLKRVLPAGVEIQPYYDQSAPGARKHHKRSRRDSDRSDSGFDHSGRLSARLGIVPRRRSRDPGHHSHHLRLSRCTGQSFNLMTLGGLAAAVGLVIDDAIVVVENIVLHRDAGESRGSRPSARRCSEITVPLVGSTITPIVVFLPLIAVTGVTGSFFRALAVTMTVSLLTSLLLALTWTPSLSLLLLRTVIRESGHRRFRPDETEEEELERQLAHENDSTHTAMPRRAGSSATCSGGIEAWAEAGLGTAVLAGRGLPGAGGWHLFRLLRASAPTCCRRWMRAASCSTTSCPQAARLPRPIACCDTSNRSCKSTPEVESISRRTGLQMGLAAVTEANTGDITVKLKDSRDRGIDEVMEDVRTQITPRSRSWMSSSPRCSRT